MKEEGDRRDTADGCVTFMTTGPPESESPTLLLAPEVIVVSSTAIASPSPGPSCLAALSLPSPETEVSHLAAFSSPRSESGSSSRE